MTRSDFSQRIIDLIRSIPAGSVATYGAIAAAAGNPRAARAVAWLLHSSSQLEDLPWHRVINSRGTISLDPVRGGDLQRGLLEREGVEFGLGGRVDLLRYEWDYSM